MVAWRRLGRVGEDHDRRFQALGAMHGHHPHLVARDLHVALHFASWRRAARRQSPAATASSRRLVVEREVEKFVERIDRFGAEPRQNLRAAAIGAEHVRVEGKRRQAPRGLRPARRAVSAASANAGCSRARSRRASRSEPLRFQASANSCSSLRPNSGLLSTVASARSSSRQQQRVGQHHQIHHRDVLGQQQPVGAGDRDAARP